MTPTAWGQGCKNALIVTIGVLACWAILAVAVALIFERPPFEAMGLGFAVLWVTVLLLFLWTWLYGRAVAGPVLLDCGRHPTWILFLIQGILWLVLGSAGVFSGGVLGGAFTYAGPVFVISFGVYWLLLSIGRLQVRENGIWQYWALLRWRKIGAYSWADDGTLLLKATSKLPSLRGALPVPPECQQAFQRLLDSHCSASGSTQAAPERIDENSP
jgi:hypothetical protein